MKNHLHIPIARYGLTDDVLYKGSKYMIIGISYLDASRKTQYTLSADGSTPYCEVLESEISLG